MSRNHTVRYIARNLRSGASHSQIRAGLKGRNVLRITIQLVVKRVNELAGCIK